MTTQPIDPVEPLGPVDSAPLELRIRAVGTPARQGSKDFKGMRHGKPILVEADERLPKWRDDVVIASRSAMLAAGWFTLDGPIEADVVILLSKPASAKREFPTSKFDGDGDKFVRAVFDALTIAGVWVDDSRVVDHHARKRYVSGDQRPGAQITVRSMSSQLVIV